MVLRVEERLPEVGPVRVNAGTFTGVTVPLTWMDLFRLLWSASLIVRFPLTFAVAEAVIRAYTVVVERLPPASGESSNVPAKPDEPFCEISLPVGAVRFTVSPLPNPLPLSVKVVVAPAVPWVVVGNDNEVVLTFSTAAPA